ncbi:hypothetical protein QWY84_10155 [Aquisalimonas lutea]|uniref:hypothetical protein n=1 Tax=Aquisalimonas lutea TaxID=1327750 RepID=UPI0025B5B231|nr:hypothetical protein [Aquisalimonas lutea]MDN3517972.1 hypothetical protein [Aquisalimonas lutea]
MTERLRTRITDRGEWPDDSLRSLRTAVEQELARRTSASARSDDDELETLEQRLLREARRYRNGSAAIRG